MTLSHSDPGAERLARIMALPLASDSPSAEELAALELGRADIRAGRVVDHEDAHAAIDAMHADAAE